MGASDSDIGAGLSVLVVDDEPSICKLMKLVLSDTGLTVEIASTATEALELLRVGAFDLVVMDKNLPDGSGLDIARHIRDHDLPCESIIITAYGNLTSAIEAMRLGVAEYLEKPFEDIGVVRARIKAVIRTYRLKQENRRLTQTLTEQNRVLAELSERDALTQLFNHTYLQRRLEHDIAHAGDTELGLVLVDIDRFKRLNETLDHEAGNGVLIAIAQLATGHGDDSATFRGRHSDVVARYGADQIAILMPNTSKRVAVERAETLRRSIAELDYAAHNLPHVTASIGVAAFPEDARNRQELIERTELALFTAKRNGRNRTVGFEISLPDREGQSRDPTATESRRLETLDLAILRCDFDFVYQPIVRASDGKAFGYEALVRPRGADFPHPLALIKAAERAGRTRQLGRSLREGSIPALAELPENCLLFINLHPDEVNDPAILEPQPYLAPWASRIVFEITEVARVKDYERLRAVVQALRKIGYRVALDDLGAGYSGLNSLAMLEPDYVKLDMELVWSIERDPRAARLVKHLIEFATEEGMKVIAEGVETAAQRDAVVAMGCPLLQGYFFSKGVPLSEIVG